MKRKLTFILTFAVCAILALAGCSGSVLSVNIAEDGKSAEITAEKASPDDFVMSGVLIVDEDDKIVIDQQMEGDSSLTVQFVPSEGADIDPDADTEEIANAVDVSNSALEAIVSGTEPAEYFVSPGEYYLNIVADNKATGTATITVETSGPFAAWNDAASAEEAAEGAGLDQFIAPDGTDTSLGTIKVESFHFKEGSVLAYAPVGAVELHVLKGINGEADVSVDGVTYANSWTKDVNGQEVTCYGNREGEATKTVWTNGDYNYAILAYGAGGDDDFGLSEQDMIAIVMTTK